MEVTRVPSPLAAHRDTEAGHTRGLFTSGAALLTHMHINTFSIVCRRITRPDCSARLSRSAVMHIDGRQTNSCSIPLFFLSFFLQLLHKVGATYEHKRTGTLVVWTQRQNSQAPGRGRRWNVTQLSARLDREEGWKPQNGRVKDLIFLKLLPATKIYSHGSTWPQVTLPIKWPFPQDLKRRIYHKFIISGRIWSDGDAEWSVNHRIWGWPGYIANSGIMTAHRICPHTWLVDFKVFGGGQDTHVQFCPGARGRRKRRMWQAQKEAEALLWDVTAYFQI